VIDERGSPPYRGSYGMNENAEKNNNTQTAIIAALAVAGTVAVFVFFRFLFPFVSWIPACAFHSMTGLHCPGCGGLRAMHALANGRFAEAAGHNALFVLVLLPLGAAASGLWFFRRVSGRNGLPAIPSAAAWFLVALAIIFAILRNLPFYPFTILAP
jgi:glucan phosphoethanolaminetransferase (alkaline phosphatase superfamily)